MLRCVAKKRFCILFSLLFMACAGESTQKGVELPLSKRQRLMLPAPEEGEFWRITYADTRQCQFYSRPSSSSASSSRSRDDFYFGAWFSGADAIVGVTKGECLNALRAYGASAAKDPEKRWIDSLTDGDHGIAYFQDGLLYVLYYGGDSDLRRLVRFQLRPAFECVDVVTLPEPEPRPIARTRHYPSRMVLRNKSVFWEEATEPPRDTEAQSASLLLCYSVEGEFKGIWTSSTPYDWAENGFTGSSMSRDNRRLFHVNYEGERVDMETPSPLSSEGMAQRLRDMGAHLQLRPHTKLYRQGERAMLALWTGWSSSVPSVVAYDSVGHRMALGRGLFFLSIVQENSAAASSLDRFENITGFFLLPDAGSLPFVVDYDLTEGWVLLAGITDSKDAVLRLQKISWKTAHGLHVPAAEHGDRPGPTREPENDANLHSAYIVLQNMNIDRVMEAIRYFVSEDWPVWIDPELSVETVFPEDACD